MPTDQAETVVTGLVAPEAPAPKSTTDTSATEAAPVASADVPLVQVAGLGDDVTVKVEEVNQPAEAVKVLEAVPSQAVMRELRQQADDDDLKRTFMERVAVARAPLTTAYVPPPVPSQIAAQTLLEMQAGADRVAQFAEQERLRPRPKPPEDGNTTAVFRPEDYVPDQKKGQGNLASNSARTL